MATRTSYTIYLEWIGEEENQSEDKVVVEALDRYTT
jgi:hypothetical protein